MYRYWLGVLGLIFCLVGCGSVALEVDDLTEVEATPLPSPFIPADSEEIELQLIAAEIPAEIRNGTPSQSPQIIEKDVGPFTLRSQSFSSEFTLDLSLELLGGARRGESVDMSFLILNSYGYFRLYTTVEFY